MERSGYENNDVVISRLLEEPYWIIDLLPGQVPAGARGQYSAVEKYFRQTDRLTRLYRKYAELLLKLNCYCDMVVSLNSCETQEINPDPEDFVQSVSALAAPDGAEGGRFLRALFPAEEVMVDLDPGDTYATIYDPNENLLGMIRMLAAADGLFVWHPPAASTRREKTSEENEHSISVKNRLIPRNDRAGAAALPERTERAGQGF